MTFPVEVGGCRARLVITLPAVQGRALPESVAESLAVSPQALSWRMLPIELGEVARRAKSANDLVRKAAGEE